jgi:hypoxanthine-guanine phosphoribosyltransferase
MRRIDIPIEVDVMAVASYGSVIDSSGVVRIPKDLDMSIEGRDVLIFDDIVDSDSRSVTATRRLVPQRAIASGVSWH